MLFPIMIVFQLTILVLHKFGVAFCINLVLFELRAFSEKYACLSEMS